MAEFIHFEAEVSGRDTCENENENELDEMKSFINDDSESEDEAFEFVNSDINIEKQIKELNKKL